VYLPVVSLPLSSEGRHLARLMAWQPHHGDPTQPEAVAQQISAALQEGRDRYCTSKRTPRPLRTLTRRTEVSTPGVDVVEPLYLPPLPSGTETVLVVHVRWCDGVKEVHLESPTVIHNGLHHTSLQLMVTGPDGHQWEHDIPPRHQWAVPVEAAPGASLRLAPAGTAGQCSHVELVKVRCGSPCPSFAHIYKYGNFKGAGGRRAWSRSAGARSRSAGSG